MLSLLMQMEERTKQKLKTTFNRFTVRSLSHKKRETIEASLFFMS